MDPDLSCFTDGYAVPSWAAQLARLTPKNRSSLFTGFPRLLPGGDNNTSMALIAPGVTGSAKLQSSLIDVARTPPAGRTVFPLTGIGQQLRQVAALLEAGPQLGITRPIFFCAMGGFGTYRDQLPKQTALFRELSTALAAFYDTTVNLGIAGNVTTYTDSECNRTLQPNPYAGTGPAWGGHQMVMGRSVLGGEIYGQFPTLTLGGPNDAAKNGVWIPTSSKDQYAATLAYWFGVPYSQLPVYLPNLVNSPTLGFMAG